MSTKNLIKVFLVLILYTLLIIVCFPKKSHCVNYSLKEIIASKNYDALKSKWVEKKELKPFSDMTKEQIKALEELYKKVEAEKCVESNYIHISEEEAKNYIGMAESGNDYNNTNNPYYIGRWQLKPEYFDGRYGGDGSYSPENQDLVVNAYIDDVYDGSWERAYNKHIRIGSY